MKPDNNRLETVVGHARTTSGMIVLFAFPERSSHLVMCFVILRTLRLFWGQSFGGEERLFMVLATGGVRG